MGLFEGIGALIFSLVVAYLFGKRAARKTDTARQTEQRLRDMKSAQEVRDEIENLGDRGLSDRASRWLRDE